MALPTTGSNNNSKIEELLNLVEEQEQLIQRLQQEVSTLQNQQRKSVELDNAIDNKVEIENFLEFVKPRLDILYKIVGTREIESIITIVLNYNLAKENLKHWERLPNKLENLFQTKGLFSKSNVLTEEDFKSTLEKHKSGIYTQYDLTNEQRNAINKLKSLPKAPDGFNIIMQKATLKSRL